MPKIKLGKKLNKDIRKVEVILRESEKVIRSFKRPEQIEGTMICQHKLGFICANSGVDQSNIKETDAVITIPENPDMSANKLRLFLSEKFNVKKLGVIITDTFGRPWRIGQVNVAIGLSGVSPTKKMQGKKGKDDYYEYEKGKKGKGKGDDEEYGKGKGDDEDYGKGKKGKLS